MSTRKLAIHQPVSPRICHQIAVGNKLYRTTRSFSTPTARSLAPTTSHTMSLSSWLGWRRQAKNVTELFSWVEAEFPEKWREDKWYLTTAAALIASHQQGRVGELYEYLVSKDCFSSPAARQHLVRRLREAMIKCIILNGIPIVMEAFQSLAKVEQPEDQDHTFTREGWQPDEANFRRGMQVLETIYKDENDKIWSTFGAHKDIHHKILDIQESELVVLPAIMCQNLRGATRWHMRGCLRVGMSREEVDAIQKVIEMVASFGGRKIVGVGRVWDVEE